ncbi:MAG: filamentous hemagglutinin N-terminal domain-containing protein, partial [Burkholderiales bacterium]|nr:filamentous hemagglutinin N-terminal domain-containing protein [Burkholderiales bacterium]
MNKTYRLIWSETRQTWIVASELANTRGKPSRVRPAVAMLAGALASFAGHAQVPAPNALPTGGQVVGGQASIATSGATMNIQQSTQRAIVNWQSFNIGANATVNFQQPNASAVALNRVLGADPSAIYGNLNANGQVFLLNPSGVVFGPGARVDVGGLVASTLNIRNEDFLSGHLRFTREGAAGSVLNQGDLFGRYVALLAPEVRNEGVIVASQGAAALAAGGAVTLNIAGSSLVGVQVDKASINTLVENRRLIQADQGMVILSAQSANELVGKVVNTGTVQAGGITTDGGVVRLVASSAVEHSGSINVDAGTNGKGGTVLAIADLANPASRTDVSGTISAKGGTQSGNGGFIETSASKLKIADSARIDTSAPFGTAGQWLLDPYDFTIAAANGDITGTALGTALASSNVTIQTLDVSASCTGVTPCGTGSSSGNGDIFVNDSVTWSSDKKLTLSAWRNVHINAPINVNGAGGGLALEFAQAGDMFSFLPGIYTVSAPVNLAAGATFSTKAATDGPVINYTVIRDATQLAAISSGLTGNYVLGTDITAPGASWSPIGNTATPFMGIFDGLGHKVIGLQHTNGGADVDVGLFGGVGAAGLIQNVGVTNVNIAGSQNVGALAGYNNGFIVNSYATGTVQGTGTGDVGRIGGLVGFSPGPIQSSYANVTVTATSGNQTNDPLMMETPLSTGRGGIGGLAGVVGAAVGDSYARGNVTGINAVGGLVGFSGASISSSYSTGAVSGTTNAHGLVGQVFDPMAFTPFIFNSFWDTTTSGKMTGGGGTADSITGLITDQMKTPSNFTGAGWDTSVAWELRSGQYPLLKQMLQPVYVIADNKTSTYNGSAFTAFTSTTGPTGTPGGVTTGSVTYTPSTANPTNAGSYTVTPGGVSVATPGDQHGYRVEFVNGTLVIDPAVLTTTITGTLVDSGTQLTKIYDGTSTITGLTNANFSLSGWQGSDGATVTKTTGTITDGPNASASTTRPVTVTLALSDYVATGTTNFSNYTLPTSVSGNIGQITPKTVTVSGLSVPASKVYDGNTSAVVSGTPTLQTAIAAGTGSSSDGKPYTGDTINFSGTATGTYNNKNVATANTVTFGGLTSGNSNYVLDLGTQAATITKANLVLSGARVYDRTTTVAANVLTATGVNGESFTLTGATGGSVGQAEVLVDNGNVTHMALTSLGDLALGTGSGGALAGNYNPITVTGSQVTIERKEVSVFAFPQASTFNGANATSDPTFSVNGLSGFVGKAVKYYDGNSSYSPPGTVVPRDGATTANDGRAYTGDDVSLSAATITFNGSQKNVGTGTVTIVGASLEGIAADNYRLPATPTAAGEIVRRPVQLSATKTYDGTTALTGNQVTFTGLVGMETLTHTGAVADSKNVVDNASNFIRAIALGNGSNGGLASNYQLPTLNNTNAPVTIDPKPVVLTVANVGKIYDATLGYTTTADNLAALSSQLGVSGDAVTAATIAYADRNAGTNNRTVTLDAVTINNGNDNYILTLQGNNTSTITPKALSLLGITGVPSELTKPAGFIEGTVGQQFAIPTTLSGSPMLQTAIAPGTGTATDGKPYDVDGPFTLSGTPQANTWTATAVAGITTNVTAPVTGLTLAGTGSTNYTV